MFTRFTLILNTSASALAVAGALAATPVLAQPQQVGAAAPKPASATVGSPLLDQLDGVNGRLDALATRGEQIVVFDVYCVGRPPERREMEAEVAAFADAVAALAKDFAEVKRGVVALAASPTMGPKLAALGVDPTNPRFFLAMEHKLSELQARAAKLKAEAKASVVSLCKDGAGASPRPQPAGPIPFPPTPLPARPTLVDMPDYPVLPFCFDTQEEKEAWRAKLSAASLPAWKNYQALRVAETAVEDEVAKREAAAENTDGKSARQVAEAQHALEDVQRELKEIRRLKAYWRARHDLFYPLHEDWLNRPVPCLYDGHFTIPVMNGPGSEEDDGLPPPPPPKNYKPAGGPDFKPVFGPNGYPLPTTPLGGSGKPLPKDYKPVTGPDGVTRPTTPLGGSGQPLPKDYKPVTGPDGVTRPTTPLGGSAAEEPAKDGKSTGYAPSKTLAPNDAVVKALQAARAGNPVKQHGAIGGVWGVPGETGNLDYGWQGNGGDRPFDGSEAAGEAQARLAAAGTRPMRAKAAGSGTRPVPNQAPPSVEEPKSPPPAPVAPPTVEPSVEVPVVAPPENTMDRPPAQVVIPAQTTELAGQPTVVQVQPNLTAPANTTEPAYPDCPTHPGMPATPEHIRRYHS